MDQHTLIKRLMATFLEELAEHIAALNEELLALEKAAPEGKAERVKRLFRTAHSLKGAARSVNVEPIESACHYLEEILAAVRDGRAALTPELFAVLFAAADAFADAGTRLRMDQDLFGSTLATLLPRLEGAAQETSTAPPPKTTADLSASAAPVEDSPAPVAPVRPRPPETARGITIEDRHRGATRKRTAAGIGERERLGARACGET